MRRVPLALVIALGAGVASAQSTTGVQSSGVQASTIVTARQPYQPDARVLRVEVRVPLANLLEASESSRVVEVRSVGPYFPTTDPTSDPFLDEGEKQAAPPESLADGAGLMADDPSDPFAESPSVAVSDGAAGSTPVSDGAAGSMSPSEVLQALTRAVLGSAAKQLPDVSVPGMGPGTGPGMGPGPMGPPEDADPFGNAPGGGEPGAGDPFGGQPDGAPAPAGDPDPFGSEPEPPSTDDPFEGADPFSGESSGKDPFGGSGDADPFGDP